MHDHASHVHGDAPSLNRVTASATLHCLTGCAIGEVLGVVIGTALGLHDAVTIGLAVVLAFFFGLSLTMVPLLRAGLATVTAIPLAFASDSFSIAVMEIVDNGMLLAVPGAMDASLSSFLFWGTLGLALAVAFVFAFPLNRYLIARGRGHAVVHAYHGHGPGGARARDTTEEPTLAFVAVGLAAMAVTLAVTVGGALLVL